MQCCDLWGCVTCWATNLFARVCTCCKCDAGVILCRPPIASRSPDQWIRKCQRTRWSRAAGTDGTALRKRNKRPDGSCTKEQSGNTKEIRHAKKQDNKPDREKGSSKMWVEVHEIEVIFTLNDAIVELSFVSVSKEATELLNSSQQGNNQDDFGTCELQQKCNYTLTCAYSSREGVDFSFIASGIS